MVHSTRRLSTHMNSTPVFGWGVMYTHVCLFQSSCEYCDSITKILVQSAGLARTIYVHDPSTKCRVGQNHVYMFGENTVFLRFYYKILVQSAGMARTIYMFGVSTVLPLGSEITKYMDMYIYVCSRFWPTLIVYQ